MNEQVTRLSQLQAARLSQLQGALEEVRALSLHQGKLLESCGTVRHSREHLLPRNARPTELGRANWLVSHLEAHLSKLISLHSVPPPVHVEGEKAKPLKKGYRSQVIPVFVQDKNEDGDETEQRKEVYIVSHPSRERIEGRVVLEWSDSCGSYGMGGPGFFGFKLGKTDEHPEEWLIMTLWGANQWLEVNGRWLAAKEERHDVQLPLTHGNDWDELSPIIIGEPVRRFESFKTKSKLVVGEITLLIHEDPHRRPGGKDRDHNLILHSLYPNDDLRKAWVVSNVSWISC